jgi:hypothetical protein
MILSHSLFYSLSRTLAVVSLLVFPLAGYSQYTSSNRDVLVPNTGTWSSSGVTLGGTSFINLGLQGVGRIAANSIDPSSGESLGSISDMQITGFTNNGNGSYSGIFNFLPDRGYNSGTTFSNYAARINTFSFNFTPYTAPAPTTQQNQITLTFTGSTRFAYDHDNNPLTPSRYTTGLLANGVGSFQGSSIPIQTGVTTIPGDGSLAGRLTVDAEGLAFDPRAGRQGSGWVSDEYGANVYHFNANKEIDGVLAMPAALVPHSPVGTTNYSGTPINGRRDNQGLEGLAVSQDGTKLYALMQSATVQDSGSGNQGRSTTRLLVYDVSNSDAPTDPTAQYVIQLPRVDDTGSTTNGTSVNRTAAESSIVDLGGGKLLILSRDGNGRGASGSPVFKSILLADLNNATNIDGLFDAEGNQVSPAGVLNPSITPISWTEALNILGKLDLSISELAQFGLNLNNAPGDINTLSEKWEGLSLVSAQDESAPNDYFLFIGNDNDFITQTGSYLDAAGNLQSYNAGLENDSVILAYRVQIVPEPSSLALLVIAGVVGLLVWHRRAKNKEWATLG